MALTLENVSVTRGGQTVLRDVSATFEPGRVTVILGPNGAGKSTLLQVAAGLLRAKGRVLLDGEDIARMPADARARAIGYLPQDAMVHWDMTVEDVVALGRLPYRDRDAAAIERAMGQTATIEFARRRIGTLSGGERSRVLLARVLAGEPKWLLADEPLASLDPAHALGMMDRLRAITLDGASVIMVVHDVQYTAYVADDVLLVGEEIVWMDGRTHNHLAADPISAVYGVPFIRLDLGGQIALVPDLRKR